MCACPYCLGNSSTPAAGAEFDFYGVRGLLVCSGCGRVFNPLARARATAPSARAGIIEDVFMTEGTIEVRTPARVSSWTGIYFRLLEAAAEWLRMNFIKGREFKVVVGILGVTYRWGSMKQRVDWLGLRELSGVLGNDVNVVVDRLMELQILRVDHCDEGDFYWIEPDTQKWRGHDFTVRLARMRQHEDRTARENKVDQFKLDLATELPSLAELVANAAIEAEVQTATGKRDGRISIPDAVAAMRAAVDGSTARTAFDTPSPSNDGQQEVVAGCKQSDPENRGPRGAMPVGPGGLPLSENRGITLNPENRVDPTKTPKIGARKSGSQVVDSQRPENRGGAKAAAYTRERATLDVLRLRSQTSTSKEGVQGEPSGDPENRGEGLPALVKAVCDEKRLGAEDAEFLKQIHDFVSQYDFHRHWVTSRHLDRVLALEHRDKLKGWLRYCRAAVSDKVPVKKSNGAMLWNRFKEELGIVSVR